MATIIPVKNETNSSASRMTKEGKKITYRMQVIQQPERARACGSGAKSSADRRPVDPPPIVELRVFEGEGPNMQEVTFCYSANFFLFATLEHARTMAQGRVPPAPTSFPVLTGTPVAGMAYLDRPTPAGYFIFPDLSVRHEGKYRLSFALYEELKDAKDMDADDRQSIGNHPPPNVDAHVSHRLEVKSSPFTVFSAKKFPGLTESTALSRMVAEQGCRVRIRRDVRMRRRENKSSKDWDEYDEENSYDPSRRTATPDAYGQQNMPTPQPVMDGVDRPRSVSNASNASFAVPPRRSSMQDMAPTYQQQNGYQHLSAPQAQSNGYSGPMQYGQTQGHQYHNQFAPPQPASLMQPPHVPYQHQSAPNYQNQSGMHMPQSYGYMQNQSYAQPHFEQPAPMRHEGMEYPNTPNDYRRPSIPQQQYPVTSQMMSPFGTLDQQYNRPQMSKSIQPMQPAAHNTPVTTPNTIHMPNGHSLAPIKTLQPPVEKHEPVSPSYQLNGPVSAGPLPGGSMSASSDVMQPQNYLDTSHTRPSKFTSQPQSTIGTKRSFGSTFDTKHMDERLQHGARPNVSGPSLGPSLGYDGSCDDTPDIEDPIANAAMSYRRADGTHRQRRVPDLA
ncbi:hypothetical protein K432DRAFT_297828 [Lepidopterella palustris CBS 459.81]|uniref:Velvet domain-containing protein n=1 Tax=Lepidopterella palustris CBS 459.81 TaxID=1314670 RepID=A0A8E2EAS5_9PEZI|nr:hypothetical protein K432DRAFT_297828 [Lepidopterella palustris CBS 459.81]